MIKPQLFEEFDLVLFPIGERSMVIVTGYVGICAWVPTHQVNAVEYPDQVIFSAAEELLQTSAIFFGKHFSGLSAASNPRGRGMF